MSRFEIDKGYIAHDGARKDVCCWLVLERGDPVHVSLNEKQAREWMRERKQVIAHWCPHDTMKAQVDHSTITAECLDCETVFEAEASDLDWTEIGRQP